MNSSRHARIISGLLIACMLGACAAGEPAQTESITVEGVVMARGYNPFMEYVLETDEGNLYVIQVPEEDLSEFETPARLRVTGRLYVADWNSRPFAHIDITEWTRAEPSILE